MVTGGQHTRAYLTRLAGHSPCIVGQHYDVAEAVTELVMHLGAINQQVTQDLAPTDDTPGRFDRRELERLKAMLEKASAELERLQALVDGLEAE